MTVKPLTKQHSEVLSLKLGSSESTPVKMHIVRNLMLKVNSSIQLHMGLDAIKPDFESLLYANNKDICCTVWFGPRCDKTGLQGFRQSEIQTSMLGYRDCLFEISLVACLDKILFNKLITKVLISLGGCSDWSASLLCATPLKDRFSRVKAHLKVPLLFIFWGVLGIHFLHAKFRYSG